MIKLSYQQRFETFKIWLEDLKLKSKVKKKQQPKWLKNNQLEEND